MTAHYIVHRSSGIEEDDGRRDPGREDGRALVAHRVSACGAANFEEVPGREQYGAGDDATAQSQWVEDMLAFHEENFHYDKGIEVRSMDRRELEVKEEERRAGKREEEKERRGGRGKRRKREEEEETEEEEERRGGREKRRKRRKREHE